ncbi:expressed unknown protein [Seminavis robusta]|uniref:Uncharacterized protein n=1 Tax=Seminavis robusta TaxID=568900 RepID=A0A9N8EFB8_9STRA|nr:expressed unknown protein [Seminavis robusta]|eukprot:Sro1107_g242060.1 n/a (412) ;mRNA; r:14189-15424
MKYRKVGSGSLYNGVGSSNLWTKSSESGPSGGCAVMRVNNNRKQPTANKTKDNAHAEEEEQNKTVSKVNVTGAEVTQEQGSALSVVSEDETHHPKPDQVPPSPAKQTHLTYFNDERKPPPSFIVGQHYKAAIQEDAGSSNQMQLRPSGMLCLEEVLLPAIAHQEQHDLKQIQRRTQRDVPHLTHIVKTGRLAVKKSLIAAIDAAQNSRLERRVLDDQREKAAEQKRQQQREENRQQRARDLEQRRGEEAKKKELKKQKETREMRKKYQPNQELWREAAYLMTESSKLEREGRLWADAEGLLDAAEKDLEAREQEANNQKREKDATIDKMAKAGEEEEEEGLDSDVFVSSIQGVISSSNSIQTALKSLTDLMMSTEKLRKDVYQRYRQDHQFDGYRGVNNPKGLIRILSQED